MKKIIFIFYGIILTLSLGFQSCVKEPAVEPNATFNTKLVDNTAYAGETFYLYFDETRGDFWTLYNGLTTSTTYDPENPKATGSVITNTTDSFAITYANPDTFKLTLVATSSGNWAEDFLKDVHTKEIIVIDRRTGFNSFTIDKVEAVVMDGNQLLFYAHKLEDLTAKKPKWLTGSSGAKVYINDVEQTSGVSVVDFSALNPGDNEGRTVTYVVVSPEGSSATYTCKYILRDPSSEKKLLSLTSTTYGGTYIPDEDAKTIEVFYPAGASTTSVKMQGVVSAGAVGKIGTKDIAKSQTVDLVANPKVVVTAEDLSVTEYAILLQEVQKFTSWKFTKAAGVDLNPLPAATIDAKAKTITVTVFPGTDLTKLVATFEGVTTQTVKINSVIIESGVTEFDYSAKSYPVDIYDGDKLLDTYTLTIN